MVEEKGAGARAVESSELFGSRGHLRFGLAGEWGEFRGGSHALGPGETSSTFARALGEGGGEGAWSRKGLSPRCPLLPPRLERNKGRK